MLHGSRFLMLFFWTVTTQDWHERGRIQKSMPAWRT